MNQNGILIAFTIVPGKDLIKVGFLEYNRTEMITEDTAICGEYL